MRKIRNVMFVVLVVVVAFAASRNILAESSGCSTQWSGPSGYSIVCNYWPDPAVCWDEFAVEESCWDWCWYSHGQQEWLPDNWGCESEGYYQIAIWCGCWEPPAR